MFAYCGNNPVGRKDEDGEAFETVFDIISLVSSVVDIAKNPSSAWAWAGLIGDVIDVAVPFVGGVGEAVRAVKAADKAVDAADTLHDIDKAVDFSGGLCFVAGTLVLTSAGLVPIEDIAAGDLVRACNPETDEVNLKPVVQTFINIADELVHIHVGGEEIICTPEHPFYSPVKGWTAAIQLRAGDILVTVNGEYVIVEQIQYEMLENPIPVYNFEVEGFHTYYVGDDGVLAHNSCKQELIVGSKDGFNARVSVGGMQDHNPPHAHIYFKKEKLASVVEDGTIIDDSFKKHRRKGVAFIKENLPAIAAGIRRWWIDYEN